MIVRSGTSDISRLIGLVLISVLSAWLFSFGPGELSVRVAMNPVDHPHGGGEGKTAGGRHPVSPTGIAAKGLKTRDNKRTDKYIIRRRGKK